jgi:hypothetical protein
MADVRLVEQTATREGYSFLVLSEGTGTARRFWWTCGGCWSRSEQAESREPVQSHAKTHLIYCSVHR